MQDGVALHLPDQDVDARSRELRTSLNLLPPGTVEDDDLPTIYVGQGDPTRWRIDEHLPLA